MFQWETVFKWKKKSGLHRWVVFLYRWSWKQVWLYIQIRLKNPPQTCLQRPPQGNSKGSHDREVAFLDRSYNRFFWDMDSSILLKTHGCYKEMIAMIVWYSYRHIAAAERYFRYGRPANQYDLVVFSTIFRSKYDSTIFLNKIRLSKQKQKRFFFFNNFLK